MAYDSESFTPRQGHSLSMEERKKLSLTGVLDVAGFDESLVLLTTGAGELSIRGTGLHIDRIDLEAGQLELRGEIRELSYGDSLPKSGLWARLFG